jgi:MerR family transcriptional regulator, repressor of the yfmOP operon
MIESPSMSIATNERFRIGELARRVGATPRAVRYYEELGLLPARGRPEGAHRLYDADDETQVRELLRLRDLLGLSLGELREWVEAETRRAALRARWHGDAAITARERTAIVSEALGHLDTQLAVVRARREALEHLEDSLVQHRRRVRALLAELEA